MKPLIPRMLLITCTTDQCAIEVHVANGEEVMWDDLMGKIMGYERGYIRNGNTTFAFALLLAFI